jgi:hypothetical protein
MENRLPLLGVEGRYALPLSYERMADDNAFYFSLAP